MVTSPISSFDAIILAYVKALNDPFVHVLFGATFSILGVLIGFSMVVYHICFLAYPTSMSDIPASTVTALSAALGFFVLTGAMEIIVGWRMMEHASDDESADNVVLKAHTAAMA